MVVYSRRQITPYEAVYLLLSSVADARKSTSRPAWVSLSGNAVPNLFIFSARAVANIAEAVGTKVMATKMVVEGAW